MASYNPLWLGWGKIISTISLKVAWYGPRCDFGRCFKFRPSILGCPQSQETRSRDVASCLFSFASEQPKNWMGTLKTCKNHQTSSNIHGFDMVCFKFDAIFSFLFPSTPSQSSPVRPVRKRLCRGLRISRHHCRSDQLGRRGFDGLNKSGMWHCQYGTDRGCVFSIALEVPSVVWIWAYVKWERPGRAVMRVVWPVGFWSLWEVKAWCWA